MIASGRGTAPPAARADAAVSRPADPAGDSYAADHLHRFLPHHPTSSRRLRYGHRGPGQGIGQLSRRRGSRRNAEALRHRSAGIRAVSQMAAQPGAGQPRGVVHVDQADRETGRRAASLDPAPLLGLVGVRLSGRHPDRRARGHPSVLGERLPGHVRGLRGPGDSQLLVRAAVPLVVFPGIRQGGGGAVLAGVSLRRTGASASSSTC